MATTAVRETVEIRLPIAPRTARAGAAAHTLDRPLEGVRVGLRHEGSWRSWILIVSVWEELLQRDGAVPVVLQTGERVGPEGADTRDRIATWAASVDCGVSGLGTCGSCTMWSVRDAVTLEQHDKPAIVAVCDEFETHGRTVASHLGHPDLKVLVLPYPLEGRPEDELRAIAHEYYPTFLGLLGATVGATGAV